MTSAGSGAPLCWTSSRAMAIRWCMSPAHLSLKDRCTAPSTGSAVLITCSSTPGNICFQRRFVELFQWPTVSFHLGREISTIDLAAPGIDVQQLEQAGRRTNQIIFQDRAVGGRFGTAQELAAAGIRKEVQREGILRAIEIEDFDRQPCGGTHVARTGQIGLVLLRKCEKVKQNWRVEFVCGERAARAARSDLATLGEAARHLSCGLAEVPAMVGRALEERQAGHRERQRLLERLAEVEAQALLATAAEAREAGTGTPPRLTGEIAEMLAHPIQSRGVPGAGSRHSASDGIAKPSIELIDGTAVKRFLVPAGPPEHWLVVGTPEPRESEPRGAT